MSEWRIVNQERDAVEAVAEALSSGFTEGFSVYTVEFTETGETRKVIARDEDELGDKIANGEFYD